MTGSILDWDAMDEDVTSPLSKAKESLRNLDTTEAEREFQQQQQQIEFNAAKKASGLFPQGSSAAPLLNPQGGHTPASLKVANERLMTNALKIVAQLDAEMQEGGRVNVGDKYLLNCQADLNQLVPFKYNWAWSIYLTSCDHHWMPMELGLEKDAGQLASRPDAKIHYFLTRFYINYKYRMMSFNNMTLLNCYRIITNPECRQYILRQSFEVSMIDHLLTEVNDIFQPLSTVHDGSTYGTQIWASDKTYYKDRVGVIRDMVSAINDPEFTTEGLDNTYSFIQALTVLYGYVNLLMNIIPMFQLINAVERAGSCQGLSLMCDRLMRDVQSQTNFIKLFISGVLSENPGKDISGIVNKQLKELIGYDHILLVTANNDEEEATDGKAILSYFANDFISECGFNSEIPVPPLSKRAQAYIQRVSALKGKVDFEAGLSGNGSGSNLGW